MDSSRFKFALPATLAVTTLLSAGSCKDESPDESSAETSTPLPDYCIDIEDMAACEIASGCSWDAGNGYCISICFMIEDQTECEALERCEWSVDDGESGGVVSCHEPFT